MPPLAPAEARSTQTPNRLDIGAAVEGLATADHRGRKNAPQIRRGAAYDLGEHRYNRAEFVTGRPGKPAHTTNKTDPSRFVSDIPAQGPCLSSLCRFTSIGRRRLCDDADCMSAKDWAHALGRATNTRTSAQTIPERSESYLVMGDHGRHLSKTSTVARTAIDNPTNTRSPRPRGRLAVANNLDHACARLARRWGGGACEEETQKEEKPCRKRRREGGRRRGGAGEVRTPIKTCRGSVAARLQAGGTVGAKSLAATSAMAEVKAPLPI